MIQLKDTGTHYVGEFMGVNINQPRIKLYWLLMLIKSTGHEVEFI